MSLFKNLSIGKKLRGGFAIVLILFVLVSVYGIIGNNKLVHCFTTAKQDMTTIRSLEDLKRMNVELTLLYMDMIIDKGDGKIADERMKHYNDFKTELEEDKVHHTALFSDKAEQQLLAEIFSTFDQMIKTGPEKLFPAITEGGKEQEFWDGLDDEIDNANNVIEGNIAKLTVILEKKIAASEKTARENVTQNRIIIIAITVFGFILGFLISWLAARSIIRPLKAMVERAKNLSSGEVDMTKRLLVDTRDEIGELGGWFNKFLDRLQILIIKVKDSSVQLGESSNDIMRGGEDLATRTGEQAASLTQTSATVEEFSTILKQNSENSDETSAMLHAFNEEVLSRQELITNVTTTMQEIDASSKKIDNIVNVINDISFQTNLLALNAAVEAARAGEAGRGFAVVASEVRNLAQKTAESSKTIQEIVTQNVESSQKGMELIKQTSEFFEAIVSTMQDMSDKINQIASGSKEQSTGVEQINQAINQLEDVTNQNASLVEEFSATGRSLKQNTDELVDLVSQFKTESAGPATKTAAKPAAGQKKVTPEPAKTKPDKKKEDKKKPDKKTAGTKKKEKEPPAKEAEDDFFGSDEGGFEEF